MGGTRMYDEDICEVDLYVKQMVVRDTIKLVKNKKYIETTEYASLNLVFPMGDSSLADLSFNLLSLFY